MIDYETDIFLTVNDAVITAFPAALITDKALWTPSTFPAVSVVEVNNTAYESTQDTSSNENHVTLTYEINSYSNSEDGRKTECRAVAAAADVAMLSMGFTRTMLEPIPNADSTIYRMVGRYTAVVSADGKVYRR